MFLVLALGVVASCVTVASSADAQPRAASATATDGLAPPAAQANPSTIPSAGPRPVLSPTRSPAITPPSSPLVDPSLMPGPTDLPVADPSPAASPVAIMPAPTASAHADAPAVARLDRRTRRKLDKILANTVKNKGVAGLQAAVRLPSGETWLGTAGKAEYTPERAIGDGTQFSIASVSKTFIAALVLQLVDEGRMGLDVPFGTYFADAPRSKNVTVRQLLSHTSGIYNYFENPRYYAASQAWLRSSPTGLDSREHRWTYDEIMGLVKPRYCKPGGCYHYSNTNYVILGKVAEAVGGAPLDKQLRQRFFKPLGMKDTVFQPAGQPDAGAAHGHWSWGGKFIDHTRDARVLPFMAAVTAADAAGAIASTAQDLSTWADALYGSDVLSRSSLRQMTTMLQPGTYGLGTDEAWFSGNHGLGHRGGLRGFESSMWHFPASGVSVVLLSNQGNWLTDVPVGKLIKAVLGKR